MKPIRLARNKDGDYRDDYVQITDVGGNMESKKLYDKDLKKEVDVADSIVIHCKVTNIGKFLSRFTLIVVACDKDEYNFATVSKTIKCFDKGEQWEYFAKKDNLEFYFDSNFKDPNKSRTRGDITYSNGWHIKLYVIEEEEIGSQDDIGGYLGKIG